MRRLARRVAPETIRTLGLVMTADHLGRPPLAPSTSAGVAALMARADELALRDAAPKPILLGRHLIAAGWRPGPEFGDVLDAAFEAQLEGAFSDVDGALRWVVARGPGAREPAGGTGDSRAG